jgi:hypothetical protein
MPALFVCHALVSAAVPRAALRTGARASLAAGALKNRLVAQVLGATLTGFIGPWIIGWIFGTATGFKVASTLQASPCQRAAACVVDAPSSRPR